LALSKYNIQHPYVSRDVEWFHSHQTNKRQGGKGKNYEESHSSHPVWQNCS